VTLLLGGGYAVLVLGLGQLLARDSSLAVAAATLAVAGLFQPVRRRVQQAVDRRFNRRRHGAATTVEAFSGRLDQQVDLDPHGRAADPGRPDDAAHAILPVAAAVGHRPHRPAIS
jgi:hypothetical protein